MARDMLILFPWVISKIPCSLLWHSAVFITPLLLLIISFQVPPQQQWTARAASCSYSDPGNPYNTDGQGQCTWWAWERRHQDGEDLPQWGNAKNWITAVFLLAVIGLGDFKKLVFGFSTVY